MKKLVLFLLVFSCTIWNATAQNTAPNWSLAGNSNAGTAKLGTTNGVHLRFFTNNKERMRLTASGLVGIGTTTPTAKLQVNSGPTLDPLRVLVNNSTKLLASRNGGLSVGFSATPPANGLLVDGNVGIGITSPDPSTKMHISAVAGGTNSTGLYTIGNLYGLRAAAAATSGIGLTAQSGSLGIGIFSRGDSIGIDSQGQHIGLRAQSTDIYGVGIYSIGGYPNGTGIFSRAGFMGIDVSADSYGINSYSPHIGVLSTGDNVGVQAYSAFGRAVQGDSEVGYGGYFDSNYGTGIYATSKFSTYAGIFQGDVFISGSVTMSDGSMKRNVQEVGTAIEIINKLKPVQYEFSQAGQYARLNLPKGSHFGLVAQDVEKVLPYLVKEAQLIVPDPGKTNNGVPKEKTAQKTELKDTKTETINVKGINYTELVPLLIKALQEQQQTITTLTERVTQLEAGSGTGGKSSLGPKATGILLEQNQPNPVDQSTTFRYSIPVGATAQIHVYEANSGKLLKTIPAPANGKVQMNASDLPSGNYVYTLTVNGKLAASKHMMVYR
ncbi:tail fiber domain-containing protein [Rufibacter roseolus]|uniref:tail fiber domain-containing protein n=1 Tax=Rufibacter roseolus TaxID=2817375 RepID=UPI001B30D106|nr:tail fiber domain-containing protein [Rufibacter roseolus]